MWHDSYIHLLSCHSIRPERGMVGCQEKGYQITSFLLPSSLYVGNRALFESGQRRCKKCNTSFTPHSSVHCTSINTCFHSLAGDIGSSVRTSGPSVVKDMVNLHSRFGKKVQGMTMYGVGRGSRTTSRETVLLSSKGALAIN
jgi:hypothetical protein